jgi:hypothetical protein
MEADDMKGRWLLFGGLMLLAANANAQGAFSFDDIPIANEPTVEVDLGPEMLSLFGEATKGQAGQAAVALEGVTNVRVRIYEDITADMQDVLRFVDATATRLEGDGWHGVVRIREGDEQIRIYMKPGTGGLLAGVTLMMTDGGGDGDDEGGGGEAMFINVAGAFEPMQLGRIASTVGVAGPLGMVTGLTGVGEAPAKGAQD